MCPQSTDFQYTLLYQLPYATIKCARDSWSLDTERQFLPTDTPRLTRHCGWVGAGRATFCPPPDSPINIQILRYAGVSWTSLVFMLELHVKSVSPHAFGLCTLSLLTTITQYSPRVTVGRLCPILFASLAKPRQHASSQRQQTVSNNDSRRHYLTCKLGSCMLERIELYVYVRAYIHR